jgi:hypothetical protein
MKNISSLTAAVGAALLLAGSPALASAQSMPASPIQIDRVQVVDRASNDVANAPIGVEIAFTNEQAAPATHVVFALESGGIVTGYVNDAGSFAQGVTVNHNFADNSLRNVEHVAVVQATFADGTVWNNPNVSAQTEATQAPALNVNPEVEEY